MPMDRSKYPPDWEAISKRIRFDRAKGRCEKCRAPNGEWIIRHHVERVYKLPSCGREFCAETGRELPARRLSEFPGRDVKIVLTVAHLNHDTMDNADSNLMALCQRCHLKHDQHHHVKNARRTRRRKLALGDLFGERVSKESGKAMSYTKGPWEWRNDKMLPYSNEWTLSPGILIAYGTDGTPVGDKIDRANCRLIAAVPDMYEALEMAGDIIRQDIQSLYESISLRDGTIPDVADGEELAELKMILAKIDAALAKARGEG